MIGLDCYNQSLTGDKAKALTNAATDSDHIPCVVCGLDGYNATTTGDVSATIGVNCGMSTGRNGVIAVHLIQDPITNRKVTPCLTQGNSDRGQAAIGVAYGQPVAIDRAFFNQGQNAQYEPQFYTDGTVPTLVARGPSAVVHKATEAVAYVDTTHADDVVRLDDIVAPLQARDSKGGKLVQIRCIVRRLTPTEYARLQGFPNTWGHPDSKDDFTDEEYRFWLSVRNTHAAINGKDTKDYTKEQILTWYNKLHTDSAEYKMWGNGIALPCARYVMEGIAEVARGELMA